MTDAEMAMDESLRAEDAELRYLRVPPKKGGLKAPLFPVPTGPEGILSPKAEEEAMEKNKEDMKMNGIAESQTRRNVNGRARTFRKKVSKSGGEIVCDMLTIRNQVKLYHWQTGSFSRHKATDDLTAALDASIDSFVEVFMGKYGRPLVTKPIKLHNFSESAARDFVSKQTVYLSNVLPRKLKKTDSDLLNIRDEILAELNKTRYLFTLQ